MPIIPPFPNCLRIEARVPVAVSLTALWMLLPPLVHLIASRSTTFGPSLVYNLT